MLNINPPPSLRGDERTQLMQVYRYLFQLSEQLNVAMGDTQLMIQQVRSNVPVNTTTVINTVVGGDSGEDGVTEEDLVNQYNELKALIQKTATEVRSEMDEIVSQLDSMYVAESEWGTYREEVSREIVDTAKYTLENYKYEEEILNIPEMAAVFEAYRIETQGYIKRGIVGYYDNGMPIFGIAIGQELASRKVTINGVEYDEFDTTANMATYTADKLSFWINGVEVAYLSNSELYVTRIIVLDSIKLGGWDLEVNGKDDLTIRREIGGKLILESNEAIIGLVGDVSGVASQLEQTADAIELSLSKKVGEDTLRQYLRYEDGTVEMGSSESRYKLQASNTGVVILQDGNPMTRMEQNTVAAPVFEAGRMLKIGNHAAKVSASGALVFN